MIYPIRPPGFTRAAAMSSRRDCTCAYRSNASGVSRQRASGLRRHVPVPEQGASTSTASACPASSDNCASSCPGLSNRCSIMPAPARSARGSSFCNRPRSVSVAINTPRLSIAAASASVLPPAPAHRSITVSPGCTASAVQAIWLPRSCTSIMAVAIGVPLFHLRPGGQAQGGRQHAFFRHDGQRQRLRETLSNR